MREVVSVAISATLGNLLFGWDSSTIAGGMRYIKEEFHLETNPSLEGLIVSMSFLTGTFATIFAGTISDMFGRRPMLISSSLMFFSSGLVMLWAPNIPMILLSRILNGTGIALTLTSAPLYISEIAPPDIRGLLNTLPQLSCSSGMFLAYVLVFTFSLMDSSNWRGMLGIVSIPSIVYFFLAVFYLPESPPWLVSKGRLSEAKKVLQRIRCVEDVSGELALLAEGMNPGGESTTIEEYIVAPASELISNKEVGKDCIKLYGPNQGEVSMIAQQVTGMMSRSMLTMSRQGSTTSHASTNLKDNIVNLFGNMHENSPLIDQSGGVSRASPFGTSDNLHAPLLQHQGNSIEKDTELVQGNGGEIPKNTDIGGGWKLVYQSIEAISKGGEKKEALQRVYLHANPSASVSKQASFASTSGYDLHADHGGGESFSASALVSHSVCTTKNMKIKPEDIPKRTSWEGLLDPGVKRALVVGIGLQVLQQASGINGIIFYAPEILDRAGVGALLSNFGLSAASSSLLVNMITTFFMLPCIAISMRLMDLSGRRSILLYTIPILILSLMILVLRDLFHLSSIMNAAITAICVVTYESVFCMGYGVIPNIICAEIFPTSVRGIFPETKGMPLEVIIEFFAIGSKPHETIE
ncbi:monosaccharide-sensing protein [Trifolium repens]|nr:monosaccharide-sensing protein [Trifolium repens]